MLKAKQMPKKKQTKQTKKPVKNDGKITKKKYIKTKIIGGGKMIQMLTLKQKLEYLKDCLKKAVSTADNVDIPLKHFKLYRIISNSQEDYDNDIVFEKFNFDSILYKGSNIYQCLQYILLCLYDHDEYNSYTLLKLKYGDNTTAQEKPTTNTFDYLDISSNRMSELENKASSYYLKYRKFLEDFIKKIISVADGTDGTVDIDSNVSDDEPGEAQGAPEGEAQGAPEGEAQRAPEGEAQGAPEGEGQGAPEGEAQAQRAPEGGQGGGGEPGRVEGEGEAIGGEVGQRGGLFGIPFTQKKITPDEKEKKFFETGMFQIYSEGILLLTIDDESKSNHTLQVFNKSVDSVNVTLINTSEKIIEFFNTKTEILIIRRYKSNLTSDDYIWDCMIQLMYKLVNILLDDDNIKRYENALKEQLETNLKNKDFLLKYKTNLLDKLIAIIFEKFKAKKTKYDNEQQEIKTEKERQEMGKYRIDDYLGIAAGQGGGSGPEEYATGSILRHGIILQSLKIIAYNNNIKDSDIENKYSEIFKHFFPDKEADIEEIVKASKNIPKYGILNLNIASCSNRKDFFQHIINAICGPNYSDCNEIDTLIKLSTTYDPTGTDKSCRTTIQKIIEEKGYLISEAYIQASELKEKYSLDSETFTDAKGAAINEKLEQYNTLIYRYINDSTSGLYLDPKIYGQTTKAILKIYDDFKTHFNSKITSLSARNVGKKLALLKEITALRIVKQ